MWNFKRELLPIKNNKLTKKEFAIGDQEYLAERNIEREGFVSIKKISTNEVINISFNQIQYLFNSYPYYDVSTNISEASLAEFFNLASPEKLSEDVLKKEFKTMVF